ncbi:MAG TPA: metalloregulator ArsR/SmtB family transcription factor [Gemmatimonadales bacterium]
MARSIMRPEVLALVAERFKALGEPTRLQLLHVLRRGEKSVSELAEETGLGQANASKHLQLLHSLGFVARRKEGLHVFYSLADESVFTLCDLVCGGIQAQLDTQLKALAS